MEKGTVSKAAVWNRLWSSGEDQSSFAMCLLAPLRELEGKRVLEVGCGSLKNNQVPSYARRYIGIDVSNVALRKSKEENEYRIEEPEKAELALADAVRLPFRDQAFDAAITANVLLFTGRDAFIAMREMVRVTATNGIIFMVLVHQDIAKAVKADCKRIENGTIYSESDGVEKICFAEDDVRATMKGLSVEVTDLAALSNYDQMRMTASQMDMLPPPGDLDLVKDLIILRGLVRRAEPAPAIIASP